MAYKTILIRRTPTSDPPENLDFGEIAFSNGNNRLHIGKGNGDIHSGYLSAYTDEEWADLIDNSILNYAAPISHSHSGFALSSHSHTFPSIRIGNASIGRNCTVFNDSRSTWTGVWNTDGRVRNAWWGDNGYVYFIVDSTIGWWSVGLCDQQWKENILPFNSHVEILAKLNRIPLKSCTWKKDSIYREKPDSKCTIIAQDLEDIEPSLVITSPAGTKGIDTDAVLPYLVAAIQALSMRVSALETTVEALQNGS